jgi:hypothetical protein
MIIKCEYQGFQICSNAACVTRCMRKPLEGHHMAILGNMPPGCICPPTSEQTCMNPLCPRKPHDR